MAVVKTETLRSPALPTGTKVQYKCGVDGEFSVDLPLCMAEALGVYRHKGQSLSSVESQFHDSLRAFNESRREQRRVIVFRFSTRHPSEPGCYLYLRAGLYIEMRTTTPSGGVSIRLKSDDENMHEDWRKLAGPNSWFAVEREAVVVPWTPEAEAFFLRISAGMTTLEQALMSVLTREAWSGGVPQLGSAFSLPDTTAQRNDG